MVAACPYHLLRGSTDERPRFYRMDKTLTDIAGWIAPIATMIAAMMTAANLGARLTGWGFVVFTLGSICWTVIGIGSGQTNLVASNAFLTLVNLVGIWRWLGRQRAYEDGGRSAQEASREAPTPTLFTATGIGGMAVQDTGGQTIGKAVEALLECTSGGVSYVVVSTGGAGGLGETLRAVPRASIGFHCDKLVLEMDDAEYQALPELTEGEWPGVAPHGARGAAA